MNPWWQRWSNRKGWLAPGHDRDLLRLVRTLESEPTELSHVVFGADEMVAEMHRVLGVDRIERRVLLRELWHRHAPNTVASDERVAIPGRLWDRLLHAIDEPERDRPRCRWPAPASQAFTHGAQTSDCIEWWGSDERPGVSYDDQLWAWGMVTDIRSSEPEPTLAALSPRLAWRGHGERWLLHPHLRDVWRERCRPGLTPRLLEGPGFMLACALDALAESQRARPGSDGRSFALMWGIAIWPILAPSVVSPVLPDIGEPTLLPDFMHLLAFHLLHPRIQVLLAVIHGFSERLRAHDVPALEGILATLGYGPAQGRARPGKAHGWDELLEAVQTLLRELIERSLSRHAAMATNEGFGFELLGARLHRELSMRSDLRHPRTGNGATPSGPSSAWQRLASRLVCTIEDALWHEQAPRYPGGNTTRALTDMTWLRWVDPDFLAT